MASNISVVLLKVVMVSVLSTWVCLWFLKPTQLWTRRWHEMEDSSNKGILGYSGLDFIFFTFPVIFVAIVGLVSMYLQSKESGRNVVHNGRSYLLNWCNRRHAIRTPLGILTIQEIIAIFLFTTILAWTFYSKISTDFKKLIQPKSLKLNILQLKFFRVATRCGLLAEISLAFLLFPVLRVLSIFRLVGIQYESAIRYHIWLGTTTMLFATLHGFGTLFIWCTTSHHIFESQIWKWQKEGRIYLAGEIGLLAGLIMWITSIPQIRRTRFETFYYTHHLYLAFLVFFLFHAGDKHFFMVFSGVFLFGLDKLLRIIQSRDAATFLLSARIFPCKTMELTIPKHTRLKYTPTSVIFIKIQNISKFQWHPFSISSSCGIDNRTITVMIKCQGRWSNAVHELLLKQLQSSDQQRNPIQVAIEGPYGPSPASVDFLRYESLIMIAGGIGIAPFLSTLLEITSSTNNPRSSSCSKFPSNIHLIYVVKSSQELSLLSSISHLIFDSSSSASSSGITFKLKLFVTREENDRERNLRELLLLDNFSKQQLITPTTATVEVHHGPEHPLLLAAVAMFSCLIFLLSLCFLNRVFLHSNDESKPSKEKMIIPSSVNDLILLSSFLIALTLSATVTLILRRRWIHQNKDAGFTTGGQDQEEARPITLTGFSHVVEHEIRFSRRPIFLDILDESGQELGGGSEVGVVVCGPESMRTSVALACRRISSGVVDKNGVRRMQKKAFTFHSLNFTL